MKDSHRLETGAKQFQRAVDQVHLYSGNSTVFVLCVEDILEHSLQGLRCGAVSIEWNLIAAAKAQWPDIVKTQNMVGMTMSIENGIEACNALANCLLAKIRRRVDQHTAAFVLEHDRRASPAIVRVG